MIGEDRVYISGGSNTCGSSTLVWLPPRVEDSGQTLVAYPLHNLVAIACVDSSTRDGAQVLVTLRGHDGLVNALSSLEIPGAGTELYSCGEDGAIRIWRRDIRASIESWELIETLSVLKAPATTLASKNVGSGVVVCACDSTGAVITWYRSNGGIESNKFVQTGALKFPTAQLPHSLHYLALSATSVSIDGESDGTTASQGVTLLIGSVDSKVHVATGDADKALALVGSLPGHEEWVTTIASRPMERRRSNSSSEEDGCSLLVATGSKDFKIRIWRFQVSRQITQASILLGGGTQGGIADAEADGEDLDDAANSQQQQVDDDDLVGAHEARLVFPVSLGSNDASNVQPYNCAVYLETLLLGHEDWVSSVQWLPCKGAPHLLSVSMDRNMILWTPGSNDFDADGIWTPICRFGDVGGMLGGSIGASLLGFTAACVAPDGQAILGIGFGGSFHCYYATTSNGEKPFTRWLSAPFLTGHYDAVTDVCWAPDSTGGEYLISVSTDQTCRLMAPISCDQNGNQTRRWCEVSRPQIHGYNLTCAALAPRWSQEEQSGDPSFLLYSAGDEKMVRIFDAPQLVLSGLSQLCGINGDTLDTDRAKRNVDRAYIPELGLSNKASELMSGAEKAEYESRGVHAISWTNGLAPLEGQLADYTVWPETKKLYGHTNDIVCMALCIAPAGFDTKIRGRYLATACKARNAATAAIIVWDMVTMLQVSNLMGHESTVSCLSFSDDGEFLASSGKDRSLCLYENVCASDSTEARISPFQLYTLQKGAHKRIVWDLSWINCGNNKRLATASRDGSCKIWAIQGGLLPEDRAIALECMFTFSPFEGIAVTAIQFRQNRDEDKEDSALVSVGSEKGDIQLWRMQDTQTGQCRALGAFKFHYCHGAAVRRMRWSPKGLLATCGDDNSVRIFEVPSSLD
jgi:elongator complex protein 2